MGSRVAARNLHLSTSRAPIVRKRSEVATSREEQVQCALDGLKLGTYSTVYSAAKAVVCPSLLCEDDAMEANRWNIQRQLWTDSEEKALVRWIPDNKITYVYLVIDKWSILRPTYLLILDSDA